MRICSSLAAACVLTSLLVTSPRAESVEKEARPAPRPWHATLAAGGYAALGGPAPYGASLALNLLPGGFAGRFGVRGELRSERGDRDGSVLVGLLYEAGAARPKLALNLVAEVGMTDARQPIVGAGIETSLWLLGPIGLSSFADLQVIMDGLGSRPVLSVGLALHIGR